MNKKIELIGNCVLEVLCAVTTILGIYSIASLVTMCVKGFLVLLEIY